jgi:hypothetical protein
MTQDTNEPSGASGGSTANSDFFERVVKAWLKDAAPENFADFERCREVLDEDDPESHESIPGHVARLCGFYFAAASEAQRNPDTEEPYASWLWHALTIAKKAYRMGLRDGRNET